MTFDFATAAPHDARVALLGIPLDRSSSFIPGSRFGPAAARIGSANIESFSPYLRQDAAQLPLADYGDLALSFATPEQPREQISEAARLHAAAGRKLLAIGGEHTITPALISALVPQYPDLCVIQFDAHSDLRDTFLEEKWCHATAMARTLDYIPRSRLFQLGIRSFSRAEELQQENVFPFQVLEPVPSLLPLVAGRPVYLTLDVDVLDPSVLPDVQTPQPGGVTYRELVQALSQLARLHVVAADVVELCPRGPFPTPSAAVVAELVREIAIILAITE